MNNMKKYLILLFCFIATATQAVVLPIPAAPAVNAKAYLLADMLTGKVLVNKNATERVEPASLTKIMTAYVAAHELRDGNINLKDEVVV